MWFIIDRDERTDSQVSKLTTLCGSLATLHVLGCRELENLLLSPEAIAQFIRQKTDGKASPTAEEVFAALNEVADELRDTTIARSLVQQYFTPYYFDLKSMKSATADSLADQAREQIVRMHDRLQETSEKIDSALQDLGQQLSQSWDAQKLSLAPGTELLDGVAQRFECRFNKDRDGSHIASLMAPSRIDDGLRKLLQEIAS